jgi:hypothetical protein
VPGGDGEPGLPGDPAPAATLRFRYSKLGKIRFTSQRDVARMWERALRRSGLPVAWSGGFSPRPLLSFGLALPTGAESLGEYVDVHLEPWSPRSCPAPSTSRAEPPGADEEPDMGEELRQQVRGALETGGEDLAALLRPLLPEGIAVQASAPIQDGTGSLQREVSSCSWEMEVHGVAPSELTARVEHLLGSSSVVVRRVRKGRSVDDDLRPGVRTLTVLAGGGGGSLGQEGCRLVAEVATRPRGVRPGELLEGLGGGMVLARACRTHQWIERDGDRREPLSLRGERPRFAARRIPERAS